MSLKAYIHSIEYVLPRKQLTNEDLASEYSGWDIDKIYSKTGISTRFVVEDSETAGDLAVEAAEKLFSNSCFDKAKVDYVILCTQSPDYLLPATACLIQDRLGLSKDSGAIDVNQGCSGYVYGLGLAKGLIESGQVTSVLVLTAETYSKYIHPGDKSVRTLFGDAAAATLVVGRQSDEEFMHAFCYGTDGAGAQNLIVPAGGARQPKSGQSGSVVEDQNGNTRSKENLYMNGGEVFGFTLQSVPSLVSAVLRKGGSKIEEVDYFVPHQANKFMLDAISKRVGFKHEQLVRAYEHCGNTVSATIPIALVEARSRGHALSGNRFLLAGFGVGYSWAGCLVDWVGPGE